MNKFNYEEIFQNNNMDLFKKLKSTYWIKKIILQF